METNYSGNTDILEVNVNNLHLNVDMYVVNKPGTVSFDSNDYGNSYAVLSLLNECTNSRQVRECFTERFDDSASDTLLQFLHHATFCVAELCEWDTNHPVYPMRLNNLHSGLSTFQPRLITESVTLTFDESDVGSVLYYVDAFRDSCSGNQLELAHNCFSENFVSNTDPSLTSDMTTFSEAGHTVLNCKTFYCDQDSHTYEESEPLPYSDYSSDASAVLS